MSRAIPLPEVAEALGVSSRTVGYWIATGALRAVNLSRDPRSRKPRWRVLADDLERFLAARSTAPPPPPRRRGQPRMEIEEIV